MEGFYERGRGQDLYKVYTTAENQEKCRAVNEGLGSQSIHGIVAHVSSFQ